MKRFVTILLIVVLFLPAAASAVTGDSPFFGRWIGQKHGSTANYSAILYYLNITKYKTSEYFELSIHEGGGWGQGKISDQDIYSGHWEIVDDHISLPTSGITSIELFYDKDTDTLYMSEWPNVTFVRIP